MTGILVDTNLLVYAFDPTDVGKREKAIAVIEHLGISRRGCLSVQCLAEFAATVTRPRRTLLTMEEAEERIARYLASWAVFDVTPRVVMEALRGARRHRMPYWDAQIWASARVHGLAAVFSEDFANGAEIEGVRFINPLGDNFDLAAWV
jgi:predicted nucleic acid-binding protein